MGLWEAMHCGQSTGVTRISCASSRDKLADGNRILPSAVDETGMAPEATEKDRMQSHGLIKHSRERQKDRAGV